jgi:hypothetical protein
LGNHLTQITPSLEYADLATLTLKRVWKEKSTFYGEFEIRVIEDTPTGIDGTREHDGFHVYVPTAAYEFKDVNGTWRHLASDLADTFSAPPNRLYATRGKRVKIIAGLPDSQVGESASSWRLVLRSWDNKRCLLSVPFRVKQQRSPVEGYTSDPVPRYWNLEK